ncbi:MAG: hypothetical protein Q9188_006486 [Gyalolechia gomerana]
MRIGEARRMDAERAMKIAPMAINSLEPDGEAPPAALASMETPNMKNALQKAKATRASFRLKVSLPWMRTFLKDFQWMVTARAPSKDDGVVVPDAADLGSGLDAPEPGIPMVLEGVPAFVGALGEETDEAFEEHVAIVCEGEAGEGLKTGVVFLGVGSSAEEVHEGVEEVSTEVLGGVADLEAFQGYCDLLEGS